MNEIIEILKSPWPWYVTGPLIGLTVPVMIYFGKSFGVSGSYRDVCAAVTPTNKIEFLNYDWKANSWNLMFLLGIFLGGFIAFNFMLPTDAQFLPSDYTGLFGASVLFAGGFLVGFGTRYAGGCTSGHGITGLATLQLSSLFAVLSFFVGGFIMLFIYNLLGVNIQ